MADIHHLDTPKSRLYELLKSATPKKDRPGRQPLAISIAIPLLLICTMLPVNVVSIFFSLTSITTIAITIIAAWQRLIIIKKSTARIIAALSLMSILSGCAPTLFAQEIPDFFSTLAGEKGIKTYSMQRAGIFGLGLDKVTIENAQLEGNIETVLAAKEVRGYGLISTARIIIAGT